MQQNLVQITSIDGKNVTKKKSSKIKELIMLREQADDSMEWSVLLADEEGDNSEERDSPELDGNNNIFRENNAGVEPFSPDMSEQVHQIQEKSTEDYKTQDNINHKMIPLSISQRPSSSTKDSSQFKDTLVERESENKGQYSARKVETQNKKNVENKIEEDEDEDTAEKNEREGFSIKPIKLNSRIGGRIAVPDRKPFEKVLREDQSPPLIGNKIYHPPQIGTSNVMNLNHHAGQKGRILVIKDKRFEKLQESSPPLHKSLKLFKKEDSMDNKHVFASITSRQNERVNLEGEYLKKIMHPADPIDQNDKMYYEEENERQYYSPDPSRSKMKRDISSAAKINPRVSVNTLHGSLHTNEINSPDLKQTTQGFYKKASQLMEIMNDKQRKESFNISNQKMNENSYSMKLSFQGPEFVSADTRNAFKSFGNMNTKSRIRLSKLN